MLTALKRAMKEKNTDMLLIPTQDPHGSEYPEEHFKARAHFSGFTGSAGTLLVWQGGAGLWTDGRYFIQAARELSGSGIELYKTGEKGVPALEEYIKANHCRRLGADLSVLSARQGIELADAGVELVDCAELIDGCWEGRPALSGAPAWILEDSLAGAAAGEKIAALRREMAKDGAAACILSDLTDTAWLLNIRGDDVKYLPVALCYAIVERERVLLFMDAKKAEGIAERMAAEGVTLLPYEKVYDTVAGYAAPVMASLSSLNYRLYLAAKGCRIIDRDPVQLMKSVKNQTELENMRAVHIKDGVAVARFMHWAKTGADKGYTEYEAAQRLEGFRREQEGFMYPSFETIAGYGENGAIVHYSPEKETAARVSPRGLLLVDSGGQYMGGTTDITRTIALGSTTREERLAYTAALEGMLSVMTLRFKAGCTGCNLDCMVREPLWRQGLDYNHGTGHGVGYMLSVHEGPNGLRWQRRAEGWEFLPGMITSDEPGVYVEGSFGVRHENLIECRDAGEGFLEFAPLTYAPIDPDAVDTAVLSQEGRERLNAYNRAVYQKLSPHMRAEELSWLREYTREV